MISGNQKAVIILVAVPLTQSFLLAGWSSLGEPLFFWRPALKSNDGFTKIENKFLEQLAKIRLSGEESQILLVIIRKTWGFRKEFDLISLSQFVDFTGINKQNCCRAISRLLSKKIITVIKKDKGISGYSVDARFGAWEPLSKKITLSKKIKPVIKKDNESLSKKIPTKETTKETITKERGGNFEKIKSHIIRELKGAFFTSIGKDPEKEINALLKLQGLDNLMSSLNRYVEYHKNGNIKYKFAHRWNKFRDNPPFFDESEFREMVKRQSGGAATRMQTGYRKELPEKTKKLNRLVKEAGTPKTESSEVDDYFRNFDRIKENCRSDGTMTTAGGYLTGEGCEIEKVCCEFHCCPKLKEAGAPKGGNDV